GMPGGRGGGDGRGDDLAALRGEVLEVHGWCGAFLCGADGSRDVRVRVSPFAVLPAVAGAALSAYADVHMMQRTKVESIPLKVALGARAATGSARSADR
ncbi:hypothetical protein, partial [Nakamurella sp.]|uniref:hypothetical protein n=1 Tax=Nakamurella sp. TaxID=1869182 RepID=UPI003B3BD0E4